MKLTFRVISLLIHLWEQFHLFVCKKEGQKSKDNGIKDQNNGENKGPAKPTKPSVVAAGHRISTNTLHCVVVPTIGVDHAAKEHGQCCKNKIITFN